MNHLHVVVNENGAEVLVVPGNGRRGLFDAVNGDEGRLLRFREELHVLCRITQFMGLDLRSLP